MADPKSPNSRPGPRKGQSSRRTIILNLTLSDEEDHQLAKLTRSYDSNRADVVRRLITERALSMETDVPE